VVTIVAGGIFVAAFGLWGGPLGAITGALVVSVPMNLRALSIETGVERRALLAPLAPWATRFAMVAVVAAVLGVLLRPATFAALVAVSLLAGGVYVLAVAGPVMQSPAGVYLQPIALGIGRRITPARLRPRWLA
jgi:hypothetical protein